MSYVKKSSGNMTERMQIPPLYEVIKRDIENKIFMGELVHPMWLQSIRETAKAYSTSVLTVKRAYELLVDNDVICPRAGMGYFVTELAGENIKAGYLRGAEEHLEKGILLAYRAGLNDKDVMRIVNDLLDMLE